MGLFVRMRIQSHTRMKWSNTYIGLYAAAAAAAAAAATAAQTVIINLHV